MRKETSKSKIFLPNDDGRSKDQAIYIFRITTKVIGIANLVGLVQ